MSRTESIDRAELYKMHPTQLLLSKFLSGEISRLDPPFMILNTVIDIP